jgi:hypothetical protein
MTITSCVPAGRYAFYGIVVIAHTKNVNWEVDLHDEFVPEYDELHKDVRDELLGHIELLEQFGPLLGRPGVDTLQRLTSHEHEGIAL